MAGEGPNFCSPLCVLPQSTTHKTTKSTEVFRICGTQKVVPINKTLEQAAERREEKGGQAIAGRKAAVLAELMQLTTPRQMRWIVQIILGNLKARLQCAYGDFNFFSGTDSNSMAARQPSSVTCRTKLTC